jgi:hypothetical protein
MCFKKIAKMLREIFGLTQEQIEPYLPIDTAEKLKTFIAQELGIECCEENERFIAIIPFGSVPDEHGYIGKKSTTLIDGVKKIIGYRPLIECQVIGEQQISGYTKFTLQFDPNNGWIQRFTVHPDYVTPELEDKLIIKRRPASENPDYEEYLALI